MVMGGDSCSKGFGFVSQYHILDGQFSHQVENIVLLVQKDQKINKKKLRTAN